MIEHKHALEDTVVKSVICFLSDKNNLDIIVKDVLNYYDQRTDETQIKYIRKRISLIKEEADDITEFVNMILNGDLNDIEFKRRLIDNLVYRIYVSDKKTIIFFNIRGGRHIEEVTSEDTKDILDNSETFLTPSDLACHRKGHKKFVSFIFCESSRAPK